MVYYAARAEGGRVACINHTFLEKLFFTERTEVRTEDTEPEPLFARWAGWAWRRTLWAKLSIHLRENIRGRVGAPRAADGF